MLGVAGLLGAVRTGNVALANAIGTGVADDKVVYHYVPAIIRYYLGEEPILGNVPTLLPSDPGAARVRARATSATLVVKAANESGGYGMLIGPHAEEHEIASFRRRVIADPRNYIAQPVIPLSRAPDVRARRRRRVGHARGPARRPAALRALAAPTASPSARRAHARGARRGSLVVNSSQGGGSKDTWVLQ